MSKLKSRYTMKLQSCGNPDYGQYTSQSPSKEVAGRTYGHLVLIAEAYQEKWNLGGGNWCNPKVSRDGKVIGQMSYNGRLWAVGKAGEVEVVAP